MFPLGHFLFAGWLYLATWKKMNRKKIIKRCKLITFFLLTLALEQSIAGKPPTATSPTIFYLTMGSEFIWSRILSVLISTLFWWSSLMRSNLRITYNLFAARIKFLLKKSCKKNLFVYNKLTAVIRFHLIIVDRQKKGIDIETNTFSHLHIMSQAIF